MTYAQEDLDEIFKSDSQENIDYVNELIKSNPDHPRILEIRFYRASYYASFLGLENLSKEDYLSQIEEYKDIAKSCDNSNRLLSFRCNMEIGNILYDALHDQKTAHLQFKSLEHHPIFEDNTPQIAMLQLELYERIVATAYSLYPNEVEKYAMLVMNYPIGQFNDEDFLKALEICDNTGYKMIWRFRTDLEKLKKLDIPINSFRVEEERKFYINKLLGVNRVEDSLLPDQISNIPVESFEKQESQKVALSEESLTEISIPVKIASEPEVINDAVGVDDQDTERFGFSFYIFSVVLGLIIIVSIIYIKNHSQRK